jgi:hypothetical protein
VKELGEKAEAGKKPGTQPSHSLQAYTGVFEHPGYGAVTIQYDGDHLQMRYGILALDLHHYHYDVFELVYEPFDIRIRITFHTDPDGGIDGFTAPFEDAVKPLVFARTPDISMRNRIFLAPFAGDYEVIGMTATVMLRGDDTLTLTVPGQPTFELVPYQGTRFKLKGLEGYSVEFKQDITGQVTGALFHQPNGIFTATRK